MLIYIYLIWLREVEFSLVESTSRTVIIQRRGLYMEIM